MGDRLARIFLFRVAAPILFPLLLPPAFCQAVDPAYTLLDRAYEALRAKDYDRAIAGFKQAIALVPDRPSVRKDLAYTLLKIGENQAARDQLAEAVRLDPADAHVELEYAFLCYETKQPVIARRVFDRLRESQDPAIRQTAAQAFENIDRPLREGIVRWQQVVAQQPANFSAEEELARLAENRDNPALAAESFEKAWRLRPARRDLLLDLGRIWQHLSREEDARAVLLAASRGAEPRVAEQARALLPDRYPYVYEFEKALTFDPDNVELRKELGYLLLQMGRADDAAHQFAILDRKNELQPRTEALPGAILKITASDAKQLGERSFDKGFLQDALKYLRIAEESDPLDFEVMLKLGWTYNMLKDDSDAVRWFNLARRSPDAKIAKEAGQAFRNLQPSTELFRTTVWAAPMFSTRWHDLFAYAQAKTELRLRGWWLHPYASIRFVGDSSGAVRPAADLAPQYLSESSAILGVGVETEAWHGATGWFEAGESLRYHVQPNDLGRVVPDYRGGISYAKGVGHLLARGQHGFFAETSDDGIYVSRFDKDSLVYSQNRSGYTFPEWETGGLHAQLYWNGNVTADVKSQYWANTVETGPGLRFRFESLRPSLLFSVNVLRGAYLINTGNPRGPNFNDLRIGIWYAFTR